MKRRHALATALAVGLAALLGTFAVTKTAALGQSHSQPSNAEIAARTAQLDASQATLDHIRSLRVPGLPASPAAAGALVAATSPSAASAAPRAAGAIDDDGAKRHEADENEDADSQRDGHEYESEDEGDGDE